MPPESASYCESTNEGIRWDLVSTTSRPPCTSRRVPSSDPKAWASRSEWGCGWWAARVSIEHCCLARQHFRIPRCSRRPGSGGSGVRWISPRMSQRIWKFESRISGLKAITHLRIDGMHKWLTMKLYRKLLGSDGPALAVFMSRELVSEVIILKSDGILEVQWEEKIIKNKRGTNLSSTYRFTPLERRGSTDCRRWRTREWCGLKFDLTETEREEKATSETWQELWGRVTEWFAEKFREKREFFRNFFTLTRNLFEKDFSLGLPTAYLPPIFPNLRLIPVSESSEYFEFSEKKSRFLEVFHSEMQRNWR